MTKNQIMIMRVATIAKLLDVDHLAIDNTPMGKGTGYRIMLKGDTPFGNRYSIGATSFIEHCDTVIHTLRYAAYLETMREEAKRDLQA